MKFRLVWLSGWPDSPSQEIALAAHAREWIEGPFPQNAAKKISELGGRGVCILEDEQGERTSWRLHVAIVHYVYPCSVQAVDL